MHLALPVAAALAVGAGLLAALLTRYVAQWVAVGLFVVALAIVVTFADPVRQAYAYPVIALAAVAGFAVVVRRGMATVALAVASVLALLPTAGVADRLGRDDDRPDFGSCAAPVVAFFVENGGAGWTEYTPRGNPVTGESKVSPQVLNDSGYTITLENYTTSFDDVLNAQTCAQRAGQRLATSLAAVLVGVLLLMTAPRGPAADFRVRGLR